MQTVLQWHIALGYFKYPNIACLIPHLIHQHLSMNRMVTATRPSPSTPISLPNRIKAGLEAILYTVLLRHTSTSLPWWEHALLHCFSVRDGQPRHSGTPNPLSRSKARKRSCADVNSAWEIRLPGKSSVCPLFSVLELIQ